MVLSRINLDMFKFKNGVYTYVKMSAFQLYWKRLKTDDREKYEAKLTQNRNRVKDIRKRIYADKELHEEHKQKMRDRYAAKKYKMELYNKNVSMHGPQR